MIIPKNTRSGTSKPQPKPALPKVLPYPKVLQFNPDLYRNMLCYVIEHYGLDGLSVLIYRRPKHDQVVVIFGDWKGNNTNVEDIAPNPLNAAAKRFLNMHLSDFVTTMNLIQLEQMQLFVTFDDNGFTLVDIQLAVNKFSGPGMIRDVFGNIIKVQPTRKIEVLDERALEAIKVGAGSYSGNLIIKPSRPRFAEVEGENLPLYAEIIR